MRKYSKFIVVGSAIAALAGPSVAMADQPTSMPTNVNSPNGLAYATGQQTMYPLTGVIQGSPMAAYDSRVIHDGIKTSVDAQAGLRGANVQAAQAAVGHGASSRSYDLGMS
jgi:hypothetical protein